MCRAQYHKNIREKNMSFGRTIYVLSNKYNLYGIGCSGRMRYIFEILCRKILRSRFFALYLHSQSPERAMRCSQILRK